MVLARAIISNCNARPKNNQEAQNNPQNVLLALAILAASCCLAYAFTQLACEESLNKQRTKSLVRTNVHIEASEVNDYDHET